MHIFVITICLLRNTYILLLTHIHMYIYILLKKLNVNIPRKINITCKVWKISFKNYFILFTFFNNKNTCLHLIIFFLLNCHSFIDKTRTYWERIIITKSSKMKIDTRDLCIFLDFFAITWEIVVLILLKVMNATNLLVK